MTKERITRSWIGWKKAIGIFVIIGAIIGGAPGTAHAATTAGQEAASSKYLSTHVDKDRSSGPPSVLPGQLTPATTRCPAFVSWEDWGGSRVHAYVDFHPSDLCNGQHVKRAYVRLVRQCGPYYDTGRLYTYTASSTSDTRLFSVSAWIYDSIIWSCNTNTYYGFDYF